MVNADAGDSIEWFEPVDCCRFKPFVNAAVFVCYSEYGSACFSRLSWRRVNFLCPIVVYVIVFTASHGMEEKKKRK